MKIEAKPQKGEGRSVGSGDGFNEQACHLAVLQKEIIRPFQGWLEAGQNPDGIGSGHGSKKRKDGEQGGFYFHQDGDPESLGSGRDPWIAMAPVSGGLNLRSQNCGGCRGAGAELVLG